MNLTLSYKTLAIHPSAANFVSDRTKWISLDLSEPNLGAPPPGGITNTFYLTSDPWGNRGWTDNINVDVNTDRLNSLTATFNVLTVRERLCSFGVQNIIDTESPFPAFRIEQRGTGLGFLVEGGSVFSGSISGTNFTTSFNQGSATGEYSFAVNTGFATGNFSFAEGAKTKAIGYASHAEGFFTTASGFGSHAEGYFTTASGFGSHAEGFGTFAFGNASHAQGFSTTASGAGSHAQGNESQAIGDGSHAQGGFTIATGQYSHAGGYLTRAEGLVSTSLGYGSRAAQNYTFVWSDGNLGTSSSNITTTQAGQFLVSASGGLFIPGKVSIGTDITRTHALTINGSTSGRGTLFYDQVHTNIISTLDETSSNGGQQLIICAGDSRTSLWPFLSTLGSEFLYLFAESGLHVNSSPNNWGAVGGTQQQAWSTRNTAYICDTQGKSYFPNDVTVTGVVSAANIDLNSANVITPTSVIDTGQFLILKINGVERAIRLWDFVV